MLGVVGDSTGRKACKIQVVGVIGVHELVGEAETMLALAQKCEAPINS